MESTQYDQERRELLRRRIQSGEQLRKEFAEFFNESARSVLVPAAEDIRAAGALALQDLTGWKSSVEETIGSFDEGNRRALSEFETRLQHAWDALQSDVTPKIDGIVANLDRESAAWSERYRSAAEYVHNRIERIEPAADAIREAALSLQTAVVKVTYEIGETLRGLSEHSQTELEKQTVQARDRLEALFAEFVKKNGAAYDRFCIASDEFLALQKAQVEGTSTALSNVHSVVAEFRSETSEGLRGILTTIQEGFKAGSNNIKTSIEEVRSQADTNAKRTRESIDSVNATITGLVRDFEVKVSASLRDLAQDLHNRSGALSTSVSRLETKVSQLVVYETRRLQSKVEGFDLDARKANEFLLNRINEIETAMAKRVQRSFLILALLILSATILIFIHTTR